MEKKLAEMAVAWKLKKTMDEIIITEPKDPLQNHLDMLLCNERVIIMKRVGSQYDVKICSGEDQGVVQIRTHDTLMEQISATVDKYGYESAKEFIAQSPIRQAKAARRTASMTKS